MTIYNSDLFMRLFEIFPTAIITTRTTANYTYMTGRFGMEKVYTGSDTENLAACILDTATAIERTYGTDRALAYIDSFRPEKVQRNEIKAFLRRR